jgi:filamentous hemagglutinin family protein
MNRIYRTLWSIATQSWQAVPETAKTAGKKSKSSAGGVVASVALGFTLHGVAHAQAPPAINQLPTGGTVARGTATISQTVTAQAAAMTVNQSSQRAVVNWNTFNLGSAASINFVQPNAQAVTLNRVNDSNPSQIFGRITSNGQVFLTNASGVSFSPTSSVDVGAITATTHSISDDNFMSGKDVFERNGATGKVVNEGRISSALGGYVALLAPEVQNAGVVVARTGTVAMAAGDIITLSIDGAGSLAGITTTPSTIATLVENKQAVLAPDGQIILSAVALNKLQAGVIKNSGSLEANSLVNKGGKIVLEGDDITLDRNSKIEAKGPQGGGTVLVGGDWQGSGDLRQATKVTMEAGATIDASATDQGDGGKVVLWSDVHNADSVTQVNGNIKGEAGPNGGNGGRIETSGHYLNVDDIQVSTKAPQGESGTWLLDPYDVTITQTTATTADALSNGLYTPTDNAANGNVSNIKYTDLQTALAAGNVEVLTTGAGTQAGNITLSNTTAIAWSTANTLKLSAVGGISSAINTGGLTMTGAGTVIFNQGADSSYGGVIAGTGKVTKQGVGKLTFTYYPSFSGNLSIDEGTLVIGAKLGTLTTGSTYTYAGNITNNGILEYSSTSGIQILTGAISGNGSLTVSGGASTTLSLAGLNTYSGSTVINAGTFLLISSSGSLGGGTYAGNITNNGSFKYSSSAAQALSGVISGTGTLTKDTSTTSTLTLSGVNTYSGNTTISAGTLAIGGAGSLGNNGSYAGTIANSGTFQYSSSATQTLSGVMSGAGSLVKDTSSISTLTFTAVNTYSGSTTISAGTLAIGGTGSLYSGNITISAGTLAIGSGGSLNSGNYSGTITNNGTFQYSSSAAQTMSGVISGTGTLTKDASSANTLILSGANTYSGGTTINAGILQTGHVTAVGTGPINVGNGGALDFNGKTLTSTGNLALNGSGINSGGALLNSSSLGTAVTYAGLVSLGSDSTITSGSNTSSITLSNTGTITGAYNLTLGGAAGGTIASIIGTGTGGLTKKDAGTWTLNGANTFTGNITISAGTLTIGGAGALGGGAYAGNIADNGTFNYSSSLDQTLSGVISGTGALAKTATSTLTLGGNNTYAGNTTIYAGTIKLDTGSAISSGVVTSTPVGLGSVLLDSTGNLELNGQDITLAPNKNISASSNRYTNIKLSNSTGTAYWRSPIAIRYEIQYNNYFSIAVAANATLEMSGSQSTDTAGVGLIFTKLGSGTLKYTTPTDGSGQYFNNWVLSAGVVDVASTTAQGPTVSGPYMTIASGAELKIGQYNVNSLWTGYGNASSPGLTNNGTLTIYSNSTSAYAMNVSSTSLGITGSGALVFTGGGTIKLGNFKNTSTGTTTITAGTTVETVSGINSLSYALNTNPVSVLGNLKINGAASGTTFDFASKLTGTGNLEIATGFVGLYADNSGFTGTTTIDSGAVMYAGSMTSSNSYKPTVAGPIVDNGNLYFYNAAAASAAYSLSNNISGTGGITINTTNADVTLTGNLSYTGNTDVSAGKLTFNSATAFNTAGTFATTGTTGTLIYKSSVDSTFSGLMSGGMTLTVDTSTGSLKLTADNTRSGATTITNGTLYVGDGGTSGKLGTGWVTSNGSLVINKSSAYSLSTIAGGLNSGTGNVSISSGAALTIDKAITQSGTNSLIDIFSAGDLTLGAFTVANSGASGNIKLRSNGGVTFNSVSSVLNASGTNGVITISAGSNLPAGNTTAGGDITLTAAGTSAITTSATGTINLFQGNANTSALTGHIALLAAGGSSTKKYKTYGATYASLSTALSGTRNFYYRANPTGVTVSGVTASKTYDGTTNAVGYITGGNVAGLSADETGLTGLTLAFATADFSDPNAGTGKNLTLGGVSLNNAAWSINGLSATLGGGSSGTINKANLTLSGTKVYDGTTVVSGTQLLATGVHNESFAVTGSGATGNLSSADVQASSTSLASITGLTLGTSNGTNTGLAANYNNLSTTGSSFSVSRATATLTATKTYDGDATLSGSQLVITGVTVGGVTQTLGYSGVASLFDPNVATPNNYVMGTNLALTNGTGLANNYVLPAYSYSAKNSATVGAKSITVSLTAPSSAYTYDAVSTYANIASAVTGFTNTTMVGSDNIASVTNSNTPVGVAQAGNFIITPTSVTMGTGLASNYSFSYAPLTVAIAKAALTVTGTSVANKTYDRTTTATLSGGLLSGVLGTDTVVLTEAGTFASANVGTGIAVTANYSIDNTNANNYTITQPTGLSANITAKALTVSGASAANKTYDGNNTATLSGSLVGVISGDTVTLSQAGTFASANAGTAIAVTASDSLGGASTGNYTLTQPTGLSADINKANATITASSGTVTYTGVAQSVSGFTVSGLVNNETAAVLSGVTASASGTNAGTYASVATGTAANYNLTFVNGALTINKANATVTASSGTTTYSGIAQSVSGFTATGLVNNETAAVLSGVTAIGTGTNAGTYASVASGTDTNYNLTFVNGALTINKANATVTANSSITTYSGVAQSVSGFTATGLVNNETTSVLSGVTASGSGINAGTYTSTANGTDSNYNLTFVNGALTINKANATITANRSTTTYNGLSQSVNGFTATGLVNAETASVLSGVTASASGTNAGTYTSTATGTDSNYNLTFVNGALTINKAHLAVTANNATKTYGDTNPSLSAAVSGFVNGETLGTSGVIGAGAASTTATVLTGAGTATITASVGTLAANNYDFTAFNNGTLTINKANATVTASSGTTTYSGVAQSVSGFTATGLVNGETASVLSGVTAGATGTNAGTYTSTASGSDSNYNLTFVNGAFTINKAPLSVVLSSQTKVYDGTNSATIANGSYTLTGFISGEGGTVAHTQGSYNSANVVSASTVTASLVAGDFTANNGTLLSNYVLPTSASGTGSITPARLSVTGTKTYDGLNSFDATALSVAGVNGETFNASGTGTMASKNVQTNLALASTSGISLNGNNSALTSNYTALTTNDTQVSVTPRAINMSAPSANKSYDGTTLYDATASDLAALSAQLVGGDRVSAAAVVFGNKDAGTGKRVTLNTVTISDDNGGNNYTVGKLDVLTGVINKAPLTVSVVNDARFIGQSDAAGFAGVVYTGFVGGETASVLTTGTLSRSNASVISAGQYNGVLQASGWQSNNYAISYNAGDYTIVGAHTLLVRAPTVSTTYGTAASYTPTAQYLDVSSNTIMTLNPVMTGNALSVNDGVGGQANFSITAANATLSSSGNVQAGGYNLEASNISKTGSNFQNLLVTGGLTVTPKILNNNLGVQSVTKVYDGSASISNFGLNFDQPLAGVTTGDTVILVGSGSFDDRHVGTGKTVNLSLGLRGADATNYALPNANLSTNVGEITQLASVTYTGAANGVWSDASNWAGGALPDRNNVAQVIVPTGKTVVYNTDQVGVIGSTLSVDGAVRFASSNAFTLTNTVSGAGDLQQRGNGMLTVSGTNTNFSGNLDIGAYAAELGNAQALGTGHVVSNTGHLSVASGLTLPSLRIDGAATLDTAVKTTGDQVYNGALTFLSSGTTQAPNFVSDAGDIDFISTVSAGTGAMSAQRALVVSAPNGSVMMNDQVGRSVRGLDLLTYLASGLQDTNPYALSITAPTIKLNGDVTTFESQTYDGAVRVGSNTNNGHTRLLVSVDPSITFKGTVDDSDPTGKVNSLDVRAISLAALVGNAPVPTITFESNVGSISPLASLRVAAGIQSTAPSAVVTDIQTDDASRRDPHYKGDIVLKGNMTTDSAPFLIAEQLVTDPNASPSITWSTGQPDFKLRLPPQGSSSVLPSNVHLMAPGSNTGNGNGGGNSGSANNATTNRNDEQAPEAAKLWLMAHASDKHIDRKMSDDAPDKTMPPIEGQMVADVKVGNEADASAGAFIQVREFGPTVLRPMQPFIYKLPDDTFVHSDGKAQIKLSATLSNGAALPSWLKFSATESRFSGTPPKGLTSIEVVVSATDHLGRSASTRVRLVFANDARA